MARDPSQRDAHAALEPAPKPLIQQMEELGVEEFYIEVVPDADTGEDAVRVIAISPKPKK